MWRSKLVALNSVGSPTNSACLHWPQFGESFNFWPKIRLTVEQCGQTTCRLSSGIGHSDYQV